MDEMQVEEIEDSITDVAELNLNLRMVVEDNNVVVLIGSSTLLLLDQRDDAS